MKPKPAEAGKDGRLAKGPSETALVEDDGTVRLVMKGADALEIWEHITAQRLSPRSCSREVVQEVVDSSRGVACNVVAVDRGLVVRIPSSGVCRTTQACATISVSSARERSARRRHVEEDEIVTRQLAVQRLAPLSYCTIVREVGTVCDQNVWRKGWHDLGHLLCKTPGRPCEELQKDEAVQGRSVHTSRKVGSKLLRRRQGGRRRR